MEIHLAQDPDALPGGSSISADVPYKEGQDGTRTVTLSGLDPDTQYHYALLIDKKLVLPNKEFPQLSFRTFPDPDSKGEDFCFAFGSCLNPYDRTDPDKVFANLLTAEGKPDPRFFLMIGDNIYVDEYYKKHYLAKGQPDAHQGLQQLYRGAYKEAWKHPTFRRALMNTPTFMIFDDHEFWNNWGNDPAHQSDRDGFPAALRAYREYQDSHNPGAGERHGDQSGSYYYTFSYGDVGFFVLDCRTRRNPTATPFRTMLGSEQREALTSWLIDNNEHFRLKFIVSSVPITFITFPPWFVNLLHVDLGDQWLGYPAERRTLFQIIKQRNITGVHFLSGDIHLGQGVVIKPKDGAGPTVYSYTASPLANTFELLPSDKAPAWASALAGGLIGAAIVLILRLLFPQPSIPVGLFGGFFLGAVAGELLRRFLNLIRPPEEHHEAGAIGKFVYGMISKLVQNEYMRSLLNVAGDKISGSKLLYQPENLFEPVFKINMGLVTVTRGDDALRVQFALYNDERRIEKQEQPAHTVPGA